MNSTTKAVLLVIPVAAAFFFASVLDLDDALQKQLTPFDCAKTYDKLMILVTTPDYRPSGTTAMVQIFGNQVDMFDNGCFITVKSWASDSLYGSKIWDGDWQMQSYANQAYLGQVECKDQYCTDVVNGIWDYKKAIENYR